MTATVRGIKRSGGRSGRSTLGRHIESEYTLTYLVTTDDIDDGAITVSQATGIPQFGDVFIQGNDLDNAAICVDIDPQQTDSPNEWTVDCLFSTEYSNSEQPVVASNNPLFEPAEFNINHVNRRRLVPGHYGLEEDGADPPEIFGNYQLGVLAPNLESFDPQPEFDTSEPVLTIRRTYQTINLPVLMGYANTVNETSYLDCEPRQWRMMAPIIQSKYHALIGYYWAVTFQLAFREETWDVQVLNQGSWYWDGGVPDDPTSATPKIARDSAGNPIIVNLKKDGDRNDTTTPTFSRFRVYREIEFNNIPEIPQTIPSKSE